MAFRPAGDEWDEDEWDDGELSLCLDDPMPNETQNQRKGPSKRQVRGSHYEASKARKPAALPTRRRDQSGSLLSKEDFKVAVCRGNLAEVQSFLDRGLPVDCGLQADWTALMYAASSGHIDVVKLLLDRGADPNFNRASYMYTPLIAACSRTHEESAVACAALILEKGANVNAHERSHMTPLMFAANNGQTSMAEQLVKYGADVNKTDNRGWAALCFAAELGNVKLVKLLIEAGTNTSIQCAEGTAADIAYDHGHKMIGELITHGGNLPEGFVPNDDGDNTQTETSPVRATVSTNSSSSSSYHKYSDLEMFLHGIDMAHLVPVFKKQAIDFSCLQCMTEADLEKIGVDQLGCRKKILESIHQLHKKKWEASSLRTPSSKVLSRQESFVILENVHLHMKYISSSIKYIQGNWSTHGTLENNTEDMNNLERLSKEAGDTLNQSRKLFRELHQMKTQINEVTNSCQIIPADLIRDPDEVKRRSVFKYIVALGFASLAISMLYYGVPNIDRISK